MPTCSWMCSFRLELGRPTKTTLLKKINSPSSNHCHLSVTLPLGEDFMPATPLRAGRLTSTCTALVCPSTNTVISYVQLPCCVWKTVSLWLSTVAGSYILCSLSSIITPEPWKRGGYVIDVPFRAENSAVPCCLHLYQSWVAVLITVCWK